MSASWRVNGGEYLISRYPHEPELQGLIASTSLDVEPVIGGRIIIAGTVAHHVAKSPQLMAAVAEAGVQDWVAAVVDSPQECLTHFDWDLAIVLKSALNQSSFRQRYPAARGDNEVV